MNFLYEEGALQDHHTRDSHLHEFAQVLLEPQFQRLESEYHLSQKLSIVCSLFLYFQLPVMSTVPLKSSIDSKLFMEAFLDFYLHMSNNHDMAEFISFNLLFSG